MTDGQGHGRAPVGSGRLGCGQHAAAANLGQEGRLVDLAGLRVQFPAAVSGRTFLSRKYDVLDALERVLERTRYDPNGGAQERERLGRLVAETVRHAAPAGTVSRVTDIWIEAR